MTTTYKYNFNFSNKEEAITTFRSIPLETLKEYSTILNEIELALRDEIEAKELSRYNEISAEIVDLLYEMKKINPFATFCLQDEEREEDIWLDLDNLIDLF